MPQAIRVSQTAPVLPQSLARGEPVPGASLLSPDATGAVGEVVVSRIA